MKVNIAELERKLNVLALEDYIEKYRVYCAIPHEETRKDLIPAIKVIANLLNPEIENKEYVAISILNAGLMAGNEIGYSKGYEEGYDTGCEDQDSASW